MNKNEKRAAVILAALFLSLGAALLCIVYYLNSRVELLNAHIAALDAQNNKARYNIAANKSQRDALSDEIYEFEQEIKLNKDNYNYGFSAVSDDIELAAEIFRAAMKNGVNVMSSSGVRADNDNENIINININLRGEYSKIVNLLSDWRSLPFPVSVSELEIRDGDAKDEQVDASVVLKAYKIKNL